MIKHLAQNKPSLPRMPRHSRIVTAVQTASVILHSNFYYCNSCKSPNGTYRNRIKRIPSPLFGTSLVNIRRNVQHSVKMHWLVILDSCIENIWPNGSKNENKPFEIRHQSSKNASSARQSPAAVSTVCRSGKRAGGCSTKGSAIDLRHPTSRYKDIQQDI